MPVDETLGIEGAFMDPKARARLQAAHRLYLRAEEARARAQRLETSAREIVHRNGGSGNGRAWGIPPQEKLRRIVAYPSVRWGTPPERETEADATVSR